MLATRRLGICLLVLASGCADSCACGAGGDDATTGAGAAAGKQGWASADKRANAGAPATPPKPAWRPAPDSDLTRRLRTAKQQLEQDASHPELTSDKLLAGVLRDRLGKLEADGKVGTAVSEGSASKLAVAARNYKSGDKTALLKITDTALLAGARRTVAGKLLLLGNAAVGHERGLFVRNYPAVLAHFDDQRLSRASMVVGGRYLVQISISNASDPEEALRVLELLDWSKLAPREGELPDPSRTLPTGPTTPVQR
jgi:hypothetical protein